MTDEPAVSSALLPDDRSPVTWTIRPSMARVTTPAPLDLFVSFRKRQPSALNWLNPAYLLGPTPGACRRRGRHHGQSVRWPIGP